MRRYEPLSGYELSGCAVRRRSIISFWGQRWDNPDPLDVRTTRVFFYYPAKVEEARWAYREVGQTRGFRGCAVAVPEERWVFLADDGEVYVVGGGVDAFEEPISSKPFVFFSNVKRIPPGRAFAVGPRRKVFVREGPDVWRQLSAGLFPQGDQTDLDGSGFSDVDGFSESDLYACGGLGDLWHFDGSLWTQIDVPTNANLFRVCCASDGLAYVITGRREILVGRNQSWTVVTQDRTDQVLEDLVDFGGKVIISTQAALFEMVDGTLQPAILGEIPPMRTYSHVAVGDGILVVAGSNEACSFDGVTWSVIIEPGSAI
jgi:hypothetical protein